MYLNLLFLMKMYLNLIFLFSLYLWLGTAISLVLFSKPANSNFFKRGYMDPGKCESFCLSSGFQVIFIIYQWFLIKVCFHLPGQCRQLQLWLHHVLQEVWECSSSRQGDGQHQPGAAPPPDGQVHDRLQP